MLDEPNTRKLQCHIHNRVDDFYAEIIRQNVCIAESEYPLTEFTDGKHYCLFHLPIEDKNIAAFEKMFLARLNLVREKVNQIKQLPEDESNPSESEITYDFRYVWFPSKVKLPKYNFEVSADFTAATFLKDVDFLGAIFNQRSDFKNTIFHQEAKFQYAKFRQEARFDNASFDEDALFMWAIFVQTGFFGSTKFAQTVSFSQAIFIQESYFQSAIFTQSVLFNFTICLQAAVFGSAKFLETSKTSFLVTKFCNEVDFSEAIFAGYVAFEGEKDNRVFTTKKNLSTIKENLDAELEKRKADFQITTDDLEKTIYGYNKKIYEALLNFQFAQVEKPERISFHGVRLCPSWFINIDSRKLVFIDIHWNNVKNNYNNENIKAELENLEERGITTPKQLFKITCRQLAENTETNNNYELASNFRRMAMETEWLEKEEEFIDSFKSSESKSKKPLNLLRNIRNLFIHAIYRFSSSYGESWGRAFVILFIIIFGFALIYTQTDFQSCPKNRPYSKSIDECEKDSENCKCKNGGLNFKEAALHSLSTATFQNVEYRKPVSVWSEFWIILEKIFAPLQAALLALAIRRKFMR